MRLITIFLIITATNAIAESRQACDVFPLRAQGQIINFYEDLSNCIIDSKNILKFKNQAQRFLELSYIAEAEHKKDVSCSDSKYILKETIFPPASTTSKFTACTYDESHRGFISTFETHGYGTIRCCYSMPECS